MNFCIDITFNATFAAAIIAALLAFCFLLIIVAFVDLGPSDQGEDND